MALLLDQISSPDDLRAIPSHGLPALCHKIRSLIIKTVNATGGHLASNLGVVKLTIALHRVCESPRDRIIWDTSDQTCIHKLVTGRAAQFTTLRQPNGISGFTSREESPHDVIGAGHADAIGRPFARR